MKTFIASLIVLLVLVTGITLCAFYLNNTISEMENMLEQITHSANSENWEDCKKETDILLAKWDKNEAPLAMLNDHEDVDGVKLALGDLRESVSHKNSEHTFKSLTEAKILMSRLKKNETLSLENILRLAPDGLSFHNML